MPTPSPPPLFSAQQVHQELLTEYKDARSKKDENETWKKIHLLNAKGKRGELTVFVRTHVFIVRKEIFVICNQ